MTDVLRPTPGMRFKVLKEFWSTPRIGDVIEIYGLFDESFIAAHKKARRSSPLNGLNIINFSAHAQNSDSKRYFQQHIGELISFWSSVCCTKHFD